MHKILKQLAWIFLILGILIPSNGLSEKVTIRYLTFETSYQQINLIKKIIAEFERRHPDIHVQLEATTEASQIFLTDMAAGTPPDVMYITTEYLSQLVDKNALIPMNAWISRDTVDMNIFFPETVQYLTFHQKLYAYPIHYSTHALFYNKHLFDKAHIPYPDENWTWDDYKNAAHKLTSKNPQTGRVEIWGTLNPDYRLIILSKGGKIFTDDATQCIIDSPVGEKAVAWATSMIGIDTPTASQIQDTNDMQMFANEKLAMFIGRTW
jgi:multiple sugar transport system substrate-binding protein